MNSKPPPLIRRKEIPKYFGGWKPSDEQLAKWKECGVIHPYQPEPTSRAWYRSSEFETIVNGPQTA